MTRESISTRASSSCPPALRAVRRAAALTLRTSSLNATFRADPVWYRDVEYTADLARGYEGHEDNFNPGVRGAVAWDEVVLAATMVRLAIRSPLAIRSADRSATAQPAPARARSSRSARRILTGEPAPQRDRQLPWLASRDTFIALPGLTLARGMVGECGEALGTGFLDDGLMPNIFGTTVDDGHWLGRRRAVVRARGAAVDRPAATRSRCSCGCGPLSTWPSSTCTARREDPLRRRLACAGMPSSTRLDGRAHVARSGDAARLRGRDQRVVVRAAGLRRGPPAARATRAPSSAGVRSRSARGARSSNVSGWPSGATSPTCGKTASPTCACGPTW